MGAVALQTPELSLNEQEAQALAAAAANVAKWYGPVAFSGKAGAWFSLTTTCAMIYGPRALVIIRKKNAKPGMGHNGGPPIGEPPTTFVSEPDAATLN